MLKLSGTRTIKKVGVPLILAIGVLQCTRADETSTTILFSKVESQFSKSDQLCAGNVLGESTGKNHSRIEIIWRSYSLQQDFEATKEQINKVIMMAPELTEKDCASWRDLQNTTKRIIRVCKPHAEPLAQDCRQPIPSNTQTIVTVSEVRNVDK